VFVYGLHRELHDRIRFTGQQPFGCRIPNKEVSIKAFFTRTFHNPCPRDCRQISVITTTTRTRTDGYPECINDFSAPLSANVRTGLEMNIEEQSPFSGKASEDANAHLQHFLEIYNTFTIRGVTQHAVHLHLFLFSLLGKAKQWFYTNKEVVSTWEKCSNAFLTMFFPLGKTNALRNKISGF
jgi:hypothetical protein